MYKVDQLICYTGNSLLLSHVSSETVITNCLYGRPNVNTLTPQTVTTLMTHSHHRVTKVEEKHFHAAGLKWAEDSRDWYAVVEPGEWVVADGAWSYVTAVELDKVKVKTLGLVSLLWNVLPADPKTNPHYPLMQAWVEGAAIEREIAYGWEAVDTPVWFAARKYRLSAKESSKKLPERHFWLYGWEGGLLLTSIFQVGDLVYNGQGRKGLRTVTRVAKGKAYVENDELEPANWRKVRSLGEETWIHVGKRPRLAQLMYSDGLLLLEDGEVYDPWGQDCGILTKHPHWELMQEWAKGKEIQALNGRAWKSVKYPLWDSDINYRLKPEITWGKFSVASASPTDTLKVQIEYKDGELVAVSLI